MGQRGPDPYLTYAQVKACHALYMQGVSLRGIARRILPRTRFSSAASCATSLHAQFVALGLPRRDRLDAVRAHNQARGSGLTRLELRRRRGEILDRPRCTGVRTRYPRKGQPCQARAMVGSDFCPAHDPARAEERARTLAAARARLHAREAA